MARFGEGETIMYTTILLAAALQNWDRYSAHALAAREVAATLAKGIRMKLSIHRRCNVHGFRLLPQALAQDLHACASLSYRLGC
jgi:hypothetical protein